jgi:hypothetical protein
MGFYESVGISLFVGGIFREFYWGDLVGGLGVRTNNDTELKYLQVQSQQVQA